MSFSGNPVEMHVMLYVQQYFMNFHKYISLTIQKMMSDCILLYGPIQTLYYNTDIFKDNLQC